MMGHAEEVRMVQLFDNEVDVALGTISEEQLQFLQGTLEMPPATSDSDPRNRCERGTSLRIRARKLSRRCPSPCSPTSTWLTFGASTGSTGGSCGFSTTRVS